MGQFMVRVPATTANLGPGYDVIGIALDIYNEFEVTLGGSERLEITVEGEGSGIIPRTAENLAFRALEAGFALVGEKVPNLRIHQKNAIPTNRGMGSSATAVLGGLLIARGILEEKLPWNLLLDKAIEMEGHPDNLVAAFKGGVVLNYVHNGNNGHAGFMPPEPLNAVLAIPDVLVSTRKAREILPKNYSTADVVENLRNVSLLIYALQAGKYELLKAAMEDRIHQPYRASLIPGYHEACKAALVHGAWGAAISGSGSTILALASRNEEEIAAAMIRAIKGTGIDCRSRIAGISREGARILK